MLNEVKINLQFIRESTSSGEFADYNTAYKKLTLIISEFNRHSSTYGVVVQIINGNSLNGKGQLNKQLESLIQCLTKREYEIFHLAIKGFSNKLISEKLFISVETVRSHRKNIVGKAGVGKIEEIKNWLLKASYDEGY